MADDTKLPYGKWRNGRPRFHPSAREIALGFQGQDLQHADGRWFSFQEAKAWLDARYQEIVQARVSGRQRSVPAAVRGNTVADLLDDWLAALDAETDPDARVADATLVSYRSQVRAIKFKPRNKGAELLPELFAQKPVAAIDKIALNDFYLYAKRVRGHHMARGILDAFSSAYNWGGLDRRWRLGPNPRHQLRLAKPQGRIVIYSPAEIRALLAAADALGRPSIGDSIILGLLTCQRQRDRLRLKDEGLIDGRRHFRQSKTKKLVPVKETPQLTARLEQARVRVAAIKLRMGTRPDTIVVDETTGREYVQGTYRHVFGEVRALAAKGSNEHALPPCPSLAHKRDQDLRDSGITWLARADNTLLEICAISGHSPKSVQILIDHYIGASAELADSGIDKLVAWMQREGIAV